MREREAEIGKKIQSVVTSGINLRCIDPDVITTGLCRMTLLIVKGLEDFAEEILE